MSTANAALETTLVIRKTYPVSAEVLYDLWTNPEHLKNWFSPKVEIQNNVLEMDLRVGGKYRVCMIEEGKDDMIIRGEYTEVIPNKKLVYTWMWENLDFEDTIVTVEFIAKGDESELLLTHERFPEKQMRDHHNEGWSGCLGRLGTYAGSL